MAADTPGQDPRALWKALDPETDPVALDNIHAAARRFDRAARLATIVVPVFLTVFAFIIGQQWQAIRDPWLRAAVGLMGLGMLASGFLVLRALDLPRAPGEP